MQDIKETLIDLLTGYSLDTYEDVQYVADELIAKGVVPVVRCNDCDSHSESNGNHYCKFWRMYCPDDSDFFCKAGKRKAGDGND